MERTLDPPNNIREQIINHIEKAKNDNHTPLSWIQDENNIRISQEELSEYIDFMFREDSLTADKFKLRYPIDTENSELPGYFRQVNNGYETFRTTTEPRKNFMTDLTIWIIITVKEDSKSEVEFVATYNAHGLPETPEVDLSV